MRHLCALALFAWATAAHAMPDLTPTTDKGVHIDAPDEWKVLVKPDAHNVTLSRDLTTNITLYWYPWKPGITLDKMLDVLVTTVNKHIPVGTLVETARAHEPSLGDPHDVVRAKRVDGEARVLGYSMNVTAITVIDERTQRIIAAFMLAPPEDHESLDGEALLRAVTTSLWLDQDPPMPHPGWWWNASPPTSLAPQP